MEKIKSSNKKNDMKLVFLDTEATGLFINNGDRMLEFAAIRLDNKTLKEDHIFHSYFMVKRKSNKEAMAIHKITPQFLKSIKAPFFHTKVKQILKILNLGKIVVYGTDFDINLINKELELCNIKYQIPKDNFIDLSKIINSIFDSPTMKNLSLSKACQLYNIDISSREKKHGALIDTKLTLELYKKILFQTENITILKKFKCF